VRLLSDVSGDRGARLTLAMGSWDVADTVVGLRPFQEGDLELLARFAAEPSFSLPYEWAGYRSPEALRRRWEEDGFLGKDPHQLVIADAEGTAVGWVMWRDPNTFGRQGWAWEIGIMLGPESRGQGAGTAAQRLLVDYLFDTTLVHRLCASPRSTTWPSRGHSKSAGSAERASFAVLPFVAANGVTWPFTRS
jgi:RimJ/RimL family protein N-acetyltransferase